jgi:glycosyltransferase involved in cell wall biosynthesis
MQQPTLTIVIPTCDRPDTLEVCLRALARQTNPAVEILIQDNASDERTAALIQKATAVDPRIVHKRSETRISMRNNFEDGVAAATGDYISIIGDDDAFCAGALDWIVGMLQAHQPVGLRWQLASYSWPSLSDANLGFFNLHYKKFYGGWIFGDAASLTKRMLDGRMAGLWEGLQIYHGAVSRKLCDAARARTGGTLFQYHIPDVYVHTALLLNAGDQAKLKDRLYIDARHPLTIYGMSGHSNGSSWLASSSEKRGEAAPMAAWERAAASDTKIKLKIQNPIRCVKYHDYAALMLAVDLGLTTHDKIDHERWQVEIVNEVEANPWQLRGFLEASPEVDYERAVVEKVKARFSDPNEPLDFEPPNRLHHVHDECWRWNQLCLVSAAPGKPDDVETAVEVLAAISDPIGLKPAAELAEADRRRLRQALEDKVVSFYRANAAPLLPGKGAALNASEGLPSRDTTGIMRPIVSQGNSAAPHARTPA